MDALEAKPVLEVLVVDDSRVSRKIFEQLLPADLYSVSYASNGAEAMLAFSERAPSIVITDWVMPEVSGLELCERIREDKSAPYTYVIVMTCKNEEDAVVRAMAAGADDFLAKPFNSNEMLARVGVGRRIIELHRKLEDKRAALEEVASTDALTGLPNRRAIEEWANKQLRGAKRHGFPIWVVLADLDSFKEINDTFGHGAGDTVLRTFADTLRRLTRISDMCGRLGGDEFLIVISHVSATNIEVALNRFRELFGSLSFPFAGQSVSVSATFGVAGSESGHIRDFDVLVRKADEMLYQAKRSGRNCVRLARLE
ncbi:MAG TPA: diguanylate cyclase [Candidatus Acidoferrum sp.]|nr:diguanylate cyclase [Candidatus Acidoferrum sp.]